MSRGRRSRTLAFLLLPAFAFIAGRPVPMAAQVIRGVVVDDANRTPVLGAQVRLVRDGEAGRGTETDNQGRFLLPLPSGGEYRLRVARMGYATALSQVLTVEEGDTVSVELLVRPDAVLLDPLTIVGRSRRGRSVFERRRAEWDRGIFLSPAMIDSISPEHPAEVLKGLENVDMAWGWGRSSTGMPGRMPEVRTTLGRGCLLYMVDFVPVLAEPWAPSDWAGYQLSNLAGRDVVAVEVYRSVLEVPPELRQHTNRFRPIWNERSMGVRYEESIHCGLVVFWTRQGW